jgi:tetratricopeptide (TPR) repeat protein
MKNELNFPKSDELKQLHDSKDWEQIINLTDDCCLHESCHASIFFFRGKALQSQNRLEEALNSVKEGLKRNPSNGWGQTIFFEVSLEMGQINEAFLELKNFINSDHGNNVENIKAMYVDRAVMNGRYDLAGAMNETRKVIKEHKKLPKYALAVQCFNKSDTLDKVFASLVECRGAREYSLVILQDSAQDSKKPEIYGVAAEEVKAVIGKWIPKLMSTFESVELLENPVNKGTAPSCRRLLDRVADRFDGFLFIEDDCLLTKDALEWASYHLEHSISTTNYWVGTCESIFFNSGRLVPTPSQIETLTACARKPNFRASYVGLDFVPSTCFFTTKDIWRIIANVRSFTRGPDSLNQLVKPMGIKTIAPVVPRASDIGMLHELGYSVAMLGKDNVKEIKQTYVLSDGEPLDPADIHLYSEDQGLLFSASVKLEEKSISKLNT